MEEKNLFVEAANMEETSCETMEIWPDDADEREVEELLRTSDAKEK